MTIGERPVMISRYFKAPSNSCPRKLFRELDLGQHLKGRPGPFEVVNAPKDIASLEFTPLIPALSDATIPPESILRLSLLANKGIPYWFAK